VKIGFSRAICARMGQSNFVPEQELLVSKYATANMSVLPAMLRSRVKARSILRRSHRRLLGTSPAIRSVQRVSVRSISLYQVGGVNRPLTSVLLRPSVNEWLEARPTDELVD
jgi:hypothetical protein